MSHDEIAALHEAIHAIDLRLARLETTFKIGAGLIGFASFLLQAYAVFRAAH